MTLTERNSRWRLVTHVSANPGRACEGAEQLWKFRVGVFDPSSGTNEERGLERAVAAQWSENLLQASFIERKTMFVLPGAA